jgi:hypothetical protein
MFSFSSVDLAGRSESIFIGMGGIIAKKKFICYNALHGNSCGQKSGAEKNQNSRAVAQK